VILRGVGGGPLKPVKPAAVGAPLAYEAPAAAPLPRPVIKNSERQPVRHRADRTKMLSTSAPARDGAALMDDAPADMVAHAQRRRPASAVPVQRKLAQSYIRPNSGSKLSICQN
jgi:hypothetical protein